MRIAVILPAAGAGRRFFEKDDAPNAPSKVEVELAGKPAFLHTIDRFVGRPEVQQILLAVSPDRLDAFRLAYGDRLSFQGVTLVAGGTIDRWQTVMLAMEQVQDDCTHIAVHDAARPLTSDALIQRCFDAAKNFDAVIPGQPVSASLKRVEPVQQEVTPDPLAGILDAPETPMDVSKVVDSVDRENLIEVQTPQVFLASLLRRAYASLREAGETGQAPKQITDDAGLVQWLGEPVHVVAGEASNIKVTRPEDWQLARAIMNDRQQAYATQIVRKRLFSEDED